MSIVGEIFHIGAAVLGTAFDEVTKTITAQIGAIHDEYVFSNHTDWYQHVGFASRPADAIRGKTAAETVVIKGDRDTVIASRDGRYQEMYGNLGPGETCLYATGADGKSQGRILLKDGGIVNLYTRKDKDAKGMVIQMDPATDTIAIVNSKGFGIVIDESGVRLTSGSAGLTLDSSGASTLVGSGLTQIDGGGVLLGSSPAALPALSGPTGIAGVASTKVLVSLT